MIWLFVGAPGLDCDVAAVAHYCRARFGDLFLAGLVRCGLTGIAPLLRDSGWATTNGAHAMEAVFQPAFPTERATAREWLSALRTYQWSKNVLIFVPVVLSHKYQDVGAIVGALLAFFAIGLIASGTYLINDLSDREADRQHKTKRHRVIARGAIGLWPAVAAALGLIISGLILGIAISQYVAVLLVTYLVLTLSYTIYLKRVAMLDVVMLGMLYTIRIMVGVGAIGVADSPWLLMFSLFFFLSLALAKRHVEIAPLAVLQQPGTQVARRGYNSGDAPVTFGFGLSTGVTAILILIMYLANDAYPTGTYGHPRFLWFIAPIVLLWIMRIWLLSHRGELDDDPVVFAIKDPASWVLGALTAVLFIVATV